MKKFWTKSEIEWLKENFPSKQIKQLVAESGMTVSRINNKAHELKLKKTNEHLKNNAGRISANQTEKSKACRFKKGFVPWNKGISVHTGGDAGYFPKGHKPANHKPVGYVRKNIEGYLEIKMCEGLRSFRLLHRVIWERCNGKLNKGEVVIFLDGNKENVKITNLGVLTKMQNMKRNSYHNYPKEISSLIQLQGAINRQLNKRAKVYEQFTNT